MNSSVLDPFSSSSRRNCFTIMITNDTRFEEDVESFNVDLSLAIGVTRVRIEPPRAAVNILDDDREFYACWSCVVSILHLHLCNIGITIKQILHAINICSIATR